MRAVFRLKLCLLAIALFAGFSAATSAQETGEPQQAAPVNPPALPENHLPGTSSPAAALQAAAPADVQECLQETGDYVTRGRAVFYVIGITNSCAARLRCEIFANVTGVKGTSLDHTVMILGPAGSGAAAKKSYDMRVKAAGGIAQVSRDCKML